MYSKSRMGTRRWLLAGTAACVVMSPAASAVASDTATPILLAAPAPEEVYVWGRREERVGEARTASEGIVSFAIFEDRPILRPGEIAEVIPGLTVTQHSGSGKANQYFLRGFNLDHGTDFSASVEGVPLNLRTHAHGQGYLDLNVLVPEVIATIDYRKGPYFAEVGDFSAAGTTAFDLFQSPPRSFAEVWGGQNDYYRLVGLQAVGDASYFAVDLTANNGPWVKSEELRKANILGHFGSGAWAFTAIAYVNTWDSTDQVPLRAIETDQISRLGTIDPTDGGSTSRFILSARNRNLDGWETVAYVQKYDLKLWSNFTYFLDDAVNGDQFEQADDRWVFGGSAARSWADAVDGWTISAGGEVRDDAINKVALYNTKNRVRIGTVRSDSVNEFSGALWLQGARAFGPLRAVVSVRLDGVGTHVDSDNRLNSGSASDAIVSPKATLAWRVSNVLELYADAGRGFHTNDARGATETIAPKTGLPAGPISLIVPAWGAETGARWQTDTFMAAASLFYLHLDSELTYAGDTGDTESASATERWGGEVLFNWRPIPRVDIDASASTTKARYLGNSAGGHHVVNAIDYTLAGGISALITDELTATFSVRHLGPSLLIEDGSVRSREATLANLLLRYRIGKFMLTGEILNVFDSHDDEIEYFYTSRLPGEPADGFDDYHIHPMEPRTWRLGLRLTL